MATNGVLSGALPAAWIMKLEDLPKPPEILSDRIRGLLDRALIEPHKLTYPEIQEIAASVVFHLVKVQEDTKRKPAKRPND